MCTNPIHFYGYDQVLEIKAVRSKVRNLRDVVEEDVAMVDVRSTTCTKKEGQMDPSEWLLHWSGKVSRSF